MSNLKNLCQSLSKKALQSVGVGVATTAMALGAGVVVESASAATIGGINIDNFAINVNSTAGIDSVGVGTVNAITDDSVSTFVFSTIPNAFVDLIFPNQVENGAGFDLALFELDDFEDPFEITINGITNIYDTVFTGSFDPVNGQKINAVQVDLSDFSVALNDSISEMRVGFGPDVAFTRFALVGSVARSTPEPSAMFGLFAAAGLLAYQRKLKTANKC
ncbi:MAG: hypothetical protein F6K62_15115 [Sphaerospermopsis sp. SIO1G2]|nr:hypothetical protein [Sphaerospermopsis sp. SIO1G2]